MKSATVGRAHVGDGELHQDYAMQSSPYSEHRITATRMT